MRINKAIHDFGYIKEAEGLVSAEFEYKNHSAFPVTIYKVISSCGCAVALADAGWLKPGESGKIKVTYDPAGRPGKFIKSFEVQFITDSLKSSAFINIRGYTIEKEVLDVYEENLYEGARLQIKPFEHNVITASDLRFLSEPSFVNFINDITYEIDQNGFANVQLEMLINSNDTICNWAKKVFSFAHKFIISEIQRRNYQPWQVGFTDKNCEVMNIEANASGGTLRISSRDFNNDTIAESGFYYTGKIEDTDRFKINPEKDSAEYYSKVITKIEFENKKDLNSRKNNQYEKFIDLIVRKQLMERKAYCGFSIHYRANSGSIEETTTKIIESLGPVYEKIKEDVDNSGGNADALFFALPDLVYKEDATLKTGKIKDLSYHIFLFHSVKDSSFNLFEKFISENKKEHLNLEKFIEKSSYSAPFQNLPVLTLNHNGRYLADTTSAIFKNWSEIIDSEIEKGAKINFVIESSVANSPETSIADGTIKARSSLKKMHTVLLNRFSISDSNVYDAGYVVRGRNTSMKDYQIKFNKHLNFIKVIPVLVKNDTNTIDKLIPYFLKTENGTTELPAQSMAFQNFISRLIPVLDKEGFIEIRVESTFTYPGSGNEKNKNQLFNFDTEKAIEKFKTEIFKRGYDPERIIITNVREIVIKSTEKYTNDVKNHNHPVYSLKFVPEMLIKM